MIIRKAPDIRSSDITPKRVWLTRREFVRSATALAAGVFVSNEPLAAQKLAITKRVVTTSDDLTPYKGVTTFNNFYEFGSDKADPAKYGKSFKPKPWSVVVDGLCAKPATYALEDLINPHPLEERVYRLRCVEGWSMVIPWVGFPLADLLKRFEPNGNASYVEFTSVVRPQEMAGQRQRFPALLPWPYT